MSPRLISPAETMDLRARILRPGQPVDVCHYAEDNLPSTFHMGVVRDNAVICNGTFIQQGHELFKEARLPYRLRGMATDQKFQRQGLGESLLLAAQEELKKRNCDLLWFNARVSAEGFYRKLGFDVIENIFDIPGVGPHKVMYRWFQRPDQREWERSSGPA